MLPFFPVTLQSPNPPEELEPEPEPDEDPQAARDSVSASAAVRASGRLRCMRCLFFRATTKKQPVLREQACRPCRWSQGHRSHNRTSLRPVGLLDVLLKEKTIDVRAPSVLPWASLILGGGRDGVR